MATTPLNERQIDATFVSTNSGSPTGKRASSVRNSKSDFDEVRKRIEAEIRMAETNHVWAGNYFHGDGLGSNVRIVIAPANGFVFTLHGCLGLYDQNYGRVVETNGVLRLICTLPYERSGFQALAKDYVPVRWGPRRYLIPLKELGRFCDDISSGDEPRKHIHGNHLLRVGDEQKKVQGQPQAPPHMQKRLSDRRIIAEVVAIEKISTRPNSEGSNPRDIAVILDAGSEEGLLPGMQLRSFTRGIFDSVRIDRVENHRSFGSISQWERDDPVPQVGWKFRTPR